MFSLVPSSAIWLVSILREMGDRCSVTVNHHNQNNSQEWIALHVIKPILLRSDHTALYTGAVRYQLGKSHSSTPSFLSTAKCYQIFVQNFEIFPYRYIFFCLKLLYKLDLIRSLGVEKLREQWIILFFNLDLWSENLCVALWLYDHWSHVDRKSYWIFLTWI